LKATRAERDKSTAATVLAHPLRVRVLEILNERDMSPIEFCREGFAPENMDVSHVAYHFRELAEYGCLTVIEEKKRRGSIEHVYSGIGRAFFSDRQWSEIETEERARISKTVFQGLLARVEGALMAETFDSFEDRHMSWIAMKLDAHGWREMTTTLAAAFSEVEQIRTDAEARLARSGEEPIPSTCAILGFESPSVPHSPPRPSD
jgi:AraC-like DNA-binding protein